MRLVGQDQQDIKIVNVNQQNVDEDKEDIDDSY